MKKTMEELKRYGLCLDTENMQAYLPDGSATIDLPREYKERVQAAETEEEYQEIESTLEEDPAVWEMIVEEIGKDWETLYTVFFTGGECDGRTLAIFSDSALAGSYAREYNEAHESEYTENWHGTSIIDRDGNLLEF